ncbi:MAG: orotate phosphoribosyltransferase [Actinomycetota bacterium]
MREPTAGPDRSSSDPAANAGLVERMVAASELHGDFVLSSGKRSGVYFDKFLFLSDPVLLRDLADAVRALLPEGVTHLAAPEGAATLLLSAVALETGLPMAVVRRQPKGYGTRARVEGYAPPGATIALLEDVSTTGDQVAAAARELEATGATIACIVLALDRGGADTLRREGYETRAVAVLRPDGTGGNDEGS